MKTAGLALLVVLANAVLAGESVPARPSPDEVAAERERMMKEVLAAISGRENEPAEQVFKNIRVLKGVPAGRLPFIMNAGFGRSLGVSCTHCHVTSDWAKDDRLAKQAAREMWIMTGRINRELLPAIKSLDSDSPVVNCTTCHRGERKPATELPRR